MRSPLSRVGSSIAAGLPVGVGPPRSNPHGSPAGRQEKARSRSKMWWPVGPAGLPSTVFDLNRALGLLVDLQREALA